MLAIIQFPISDLRDFTCNSVRLQRPGWPSPLPDQEYVRGFGAIRERPRGGLTGWIGESFYCSAEGVAKIHESNFINGDEFRGNKRKVVFRRFYFDGLAVGKLEIGISIKNRKFSLNPIHTINATNLIIGLLNIKLRDPKQFGKNESHSTIGSFPQLLRSAYIHSTSLKNTSFDDQKSFVINGRSQFYLEFKTGELDIPPYARHYTIKLSKFHFFRVFYWIERVSGIGYPILATEVSPLASTPTEARKLRIFLLRLYAETQTLSHVLNALADGRLEPTSRTKTSDLLQRYLSEAVRRIEQLEQSSRRVTNDKLVNLVREIDDLLRPGQRSVLLNRVQQWNPRPTVSRAIKRFIEPAENLYRAETMYIVGCNITKDTYNNYGQAGNVGPDGMSQGNIFNQHSGCFDHDKLCEELSLLLENLRNRMLNGDNTIDVQMIESSVSHLRQGDTKSAAGYLKRCSTWVMEIAKEIGVGLAVEALKGGLGS